MEDNPEKEMTSLLSKQEIVSTSSSDEEIIIPEKHPFQHKIEMTRGEWIRTYILTLTLLPLRVIGLLITVLTSWVMASIALYGLSEEEKARNPMTGWRRKIKHIGSFLGRLAFRITGFHSVEIIGTPASRDEAPILVVAPHSTYFDGFVVFWCGVPYIVNRTENKNLPFFGKCIELIEAVFVSREVTNSRAQTIKEIIRRSNDPAWPQLIIFPEGSTSNRTALMNYKPGAFYPGKPIQPILIRYPNKIDTVTWTWDQQHGAKSVAWLTLSQPSHKAVLEFLPVYSPSQEEISDAKLYASNVRKLMADALKVPLCNETYEEVRAKYAHKYKSKSKKDNKKDK